MQAIIQSFLEFGYHGLKPKVGGYDWQELHQLNDSIAWQDWASCVLEQHTRGDLDLDRFLTERAMRRRQSSALQPAGATAAGGAGSASGSSSSLGGHISGNNLWHTPQGAVLDGKSGNNKGMASCVLCFSWMLLPWGFRRCPVCQ